MKYHVVTDNPRFITLEFNFPTTEPITTLIVTL